MTSCQLLETIRIENGEALNISYHNQRFNRSRKELFSIDRSIDLSKVITPPDKGVYRCRILYDHNIRTIEYLSYQPKIIQTIAIVESSISYPYKYADRKQLEALLATSPQADDVLISQNGYLTDTTIANIALLEKGRWITPDNPLLEGTTRRRLINEGFLTPKSIIIDEINQFDGFALMNAMIGFKVIKSPTIMY